MRLVYFSSQSIALKGAFVFKVKTIKLIVILSALFFVACQKEQTFKADGSPEIVVNLPFYGMKSLNPFIWAEQQVLAQGTIFEGLVGYDDELNVVLKVADSIEISLDRKVWVYKLKKNKKWSNGDPVTANDFIYSWKTFLKPGNSSPMWASFMYEVVNANEYHNGSKEWDSVGLRAIDDFTIEIKLNEAADVSGKMILGTGMPLHKGSYETSLANNRQWWKPENIIVNGPYMPTKFVADGEVELIPNSHYQGKRGNVDRFVLHPGGLTVQVQNYEAGDLDLAHILTLGDYRYVTSGGRISHQYVEEEELGFMGYQIARTLNPLLEEPKIRQALAMAIDRKVIAEKVMGNRVVPTTVYGPPSDSMLQGLNSFKYNPAHAKKLLQDVGYFKNKPVIYIFAPPSTDPRGWASVTEVLHSQWKEIGLNVLIENMEDGMLNEYSWGGAYHKGSQFKRPGVTMYTGPMIYKTPQTLMRLSEHNYYYHNYPYETKKKIKKLEIEKKYLSTVARGVDDIDWAIIDELAEDIQFTQDSLKKSELNLNFKNEIMRPNFYESYQMVRKKYSDNMTPADKVDLWRSCRLLIYDAQIKFIKISKNDQNLDGWRMLADLKGAGPDQVQDIVPRLQQSILDQAWIVPLYSQKLVYVKKPWLSGVVLNKFGAWLSAFNLQYMEVDTLGYLD